MRREEAVGTAKPCHTLPSSAKQSLSMPDWRTIDYFFDESLVEDPYPYFEELRAEGPVVALPHLGVVAVTGYDEAHEVYRDTTSFSSCISVVGPFAQFP